MNFIENSILVCLYSTLIGNTVGDNFEPCNSTVYLWQNWQYWMYFLCFLNVIVVQTALVLKRQYLIHLCIHGAGKPHVISWLITACITILLLAKMNQWWFGILYNHGTCSPIIQFSYIITQVQFTSLISNPPSSPSTSDIRMILRMIGQLLSDR